MKSNKRSNESFSQSQRNKADPIQVIAGIVIVVVVAIMIWILVPKTSNNILSTPVLTPTNSESVSSSVEPVVVTVKPSLTATEAPVPTKTPKPTSTPVPVTPTSMTTPMPEWSFKIEFHFGSLFVLPCINSTGKSYSGTDINAYFEKGYIELVTPDGDKKIFEKNPAPDPMLEGAGISGLTKGATQCIVGLRVNHEELLKKLTSGKYSIIWKSGDLQSNEITFDWNGTSITTIDN